MYKNGKSTNASRAIFVNEASADVDFKFGPFDSKSEAVTKLTEWGALVPGVEVGVKTGTKVINGVTYDLVTRYYFKDGIAESNLVEIGLSNYMTRTEVTNIIASAITEYDKNSVKGISVKTIEGVKSVCLTKSSGEVVSKFPVADLGLSDAVESVADPVITASNNVCTITTETEGAKIYWQYGNTVNTTSGNLYSGSFAIEFSDIEDEVEISAIAVKNNVASGISTLSVERVVLVEAPSFIQTGNAIAITCKTPNSVIYYTIDGTVPTVERGRAYENKSIVLSDDCVISAIAVASGKTSRVSTYNFTYTAPEGEEDATPSVGSPFVVATWNVGRWCLGKSFYASYSDSTTNNKKVIADSSNYKTIAAKVKNALAQIDSTNKIPAILFTQETNEEFYRWGSVTDTEVFNDFENKIHPLASDSSKYGHGRNAIYTRHMSSIGEGEAVLLEKNTLHSTYPYYTKSIVTIGNKEVVLVCTHFPPTASNYTTAQMTAIAKLNQRIAQKIISDMASYPYVIICADFNEREFTLMPNTPFNFVSATSEKYKIQALYPCGFAAAGYGCMSGTVTGNNGIWHMPIDKTTSPWTYADLQVNGSGTNYWKVDNILFKGFTVSNPGIIDVSSEPTTDAAGNTKTNNVPDGTLLSDHDILYCTLTFKEEQN